MTEQMTAYLTIKNNTVELSNMNTEEVIGYSWTAKQLASQLAYANVGQIYKSSSIDFSEEYGFTDAVEMVQEAMELVESGDVAPILENSPTI
jgi:hypothetical protein